MDKISAIEKVRFLLNLGNTESTPEHEASAAKLAAQKLIEKFELSLEDYQVVEIKPVYTDDDLLFETKDLQEHLLQLALAVASKYDCFAIQEINQASDGDRVYRYFVYGDETDIVRVKALFSFVKVEMDKYVAIYCRGRGKLYIDSFCEGLVNGVRINIETEDFHIDGLVPVKKETESSPEALVVTEKEKKEPPPIEEKTIIDKKDERPLDIVAYWTGEKKGASIHIGKAMDHFLPEEIENNYEEENYDLLLKAFESIKGKDLTNE